MDYIEQLKRKSEKLAIEREKATSTPYYNDERVERMEKFQKTVKNYTRTGLHNKAALGFPVFMDTVSHLDYVEREKLRIAQEEQDRRPKYKSRTQKGYLFYDKSAREDLLVLARSKKQALRIIDALSKETGSEFMFDKHQNEKGTSILKWQ